MSVIFCDSVFDNKIIEPDYVDEKKASHKVGFDFSLISFEELTNGNVTTALRFVKYLKKKKSEYTEGGC